MALSGDNSNVLKTKKSTTGYVFDEEYIKHVIDPTHPESPQRLLTIKEIMNSSGLIKKLIPIEPIEDPIPYISMIHTKRHIESIQNIAVSGKIAEKAVAGALGAVKAVMSGKVQNAFCAIRPPGHHANNSGAEEGFCYYNNVAIAARYAQKMYGCKNVLIVDWDYHHGNATENAFYEDDTVFFFSTHRWPAYPLSGAPTRIGSAKGRGYNLNCPLPSAENPYGPVSDADIINAFQNKLIPAIEKIGFKPDIVLVSAGFDSRKGDALGDFDISYECFEKLTKIVLEIVTCYCKGRFVSVLEGGYINPTYDRLGFAKAVAAHVGALLQ